MLLRLPNELFNLIAENCGPDELNALLETHPAFTPLLKHLLGQYVRKPRTVFSVERKVVAKGTGRAYSTLYYTSPIHYFEHHLDPAIVSDLLIAQDSVPILSDRIVQKHALPVWAVLNNRVALLRNLLDCGLDIDGLYQWEGYPCYRLVEIAVEHKRYLDLAQMLIKRGASVEDSAGEVLYPTLLHKLCRWSGMLERPEKEARMVRMLVEKGVDINKISTLSGLTTALHAATAIGLAPLVICTMVEMGANVTAVDEEGNTALHNICVHEMEDISPIRALLAAGTDVNVRNGRGETPLLMAMKYQPWNLELVQFLIEEHHADVKTAADTGLTPLHLAAGRSLQQMAVEQDRAENIWKLKTCRRMEVEVNDTEWSVLQLLLAHGADVNASSTASIGGPLHFASAIGCTPIVKFLLDNGADLNACASFCGTPLHCAVESRRPEVAKLLLGRGAKVDERDGNGTTPLMVAAECGWIEFMDLLQEAGANINTGVSVEGRKS